MPVAANCWLVPAAMDGLAGVTVIEINEAAVMVALPAATAFTSPVLETVAVAAEEELQVAVLVRSCVLPSL